MKQEYNSDDPINFIKDIKKYLKDKRYIKIEQKPVLGLYEPNKIPNIANVIGIWREKSREFGIGEIFIIISINRNRTQDFQNLDLFNASYEFPPRNSFQNNRILIKKTLIYSELLYKSKHLDETTMNLKKFPFFRGSMVEWDNCPRINNCEIFDYYSPEQFYLFNKLIIDWTLKHYNKDFRFIFINAWNEWGEGSYLEPDDKFGYASINSLSKAVFNLSYYEKYNLLNIKTIAVLASINNQDSIKEIINKTNNIPFIYDLFIIYNKKINEEEIKKYINLNSKAHYFEVISAINKRENLLYSFSKFRNKTKNYKYICNINENLNKNINFFEEWKGYIYNNLLGNNEIVSEIITDLEKNNKLGIIFPEKYYKSLIAFGDHLDNINLKYLNFILNKINPRVYSSPSSLDFPDGNMFWAKICAIYPLFNLYSNLTLNKKLALIMKNNLEKVWIYIVKLNGFLYKTIFKHL